MSDFVIQQATATPFLRVTVSQVRFATIWLLMAGISFFNLTSLNQQKYDVGIDVSVLLKLGMTGLGGLVGFITLANSRSMRAFLLQWPGLLFPVLVMFFILTSFSSITVVPSLASSLALACVVLFTSAAVFTIGVERSLAAIVAGMGVYIVASWFVYLFVPSVGLHTEDLGEGIEILRMAGLSHANTTGQYAAMFLGFIAISYQRWSWKKSFIFSGIVAVVVLLALAALVEAMSRSSVIALVVASAFAFRRPLFRFTGPVLPFFVATAACGLLLLAVSVPGGFFAIEDKLTVFTKTGSTEEITSMTGRTEIWAYSIERLAERPFTGWGPATSKLILVDYMYYTHNMWLNIFFSCGVFAGAVSVALTLVALRNLFLFHDRFIDFALVFLCVGGLVENFAFAYIPSAPTQLLVLVVAWQHLLSVSHRKHAHSSQHHRLAVSEGS